MPNDAAKAPPQTPQQTVATAGAAAREEEPLPPLASESALPEALRAMIGDRPVWLQVDGGIAPDAARLCREAGASSFVAGSSVFRGGPAAYAANIAALRVAAS